MLNLNSIYYYNTFSRNSLTSYKDKNKSYFEKIDSIITEFIKKNKYKTLLDVGCGDGIRSNNICLECDISDPVLIDNCQNMIDLCAENDYKASLCEADKQFDKKFDIILCIANLLGHIDNEENVIESINHNLNNNGVAFVEINNRYNINKYGLFKVIINLFKDFFKIKNGFYKIKNKYLVYLYAPQEIDKLLNKYFKVEKRCIDSDGCIKKSQFQGQILYILSKK